MADTRLEQYRPPAGVDRSIEAMEARLAELQPALGSLMEKAVQLFDDVFPQARSPLVTPLPHHVFSTSSMNYCKIEQVPMVRELTVVLGANKFVKVFRNTASLGLTWPLERLWSSRPEGDGRRNVDVTRINTAWLKPLPYNIETVDYNINDRFLGFLAGGVYFDDAPFITEASLALDDARKVAEKYGFLVPTVQS